MAYTDKDAIYAIAEKLGWSGTEGQTTVEAVYAVAEALGYTGDHDNQVALALSDLKTVVGGGGGGGSYGPSMVVYGSEYSAPPVVGNICGATWGAIKAYAGDTLIFEANPASTFNRNVQLATGLVVETTPYPASWSCGVYAVTVDNDSVYTAVRQLDVTLTSHATTIQGQDAQYWTFTIAEGVLESGEFVMLHPHA